ncbi:MAG: hypothetical protein M3R27_08025 [Bacteroidota bacterium]|nr:hypothetical protein [Bacteroidota bacterium]
MKFLKSAIPLLLIGSLLASCGNYRRLLTDEVVLKDGNSHTGTIIKTDSTKIRLMKIDQSISIIPWNTVDTVQGKKLMTLWAGVNAGYFNIPYFSVFRNEAMTGKSAGIQYKAGLAFRGVKLYYIHLTFAPAQPYAITKSGIGFQRYLGKTTYLKKNCFFVGGELNLMNAKFNTGAQTTLEPFTGFEKKCNEHIRLHFKFGLQFNIANKNSQTGFNTSIGIHFMRRNFKKHYETLNREHHFYGK